MKYQYITIEREFGSGGTRIGELLAKECKMPCYGREILECVARMIFPWNRLNSMRRV